jgi:hypothetical protein
MRYPDAGGERVGAREQDVLYIVDLDDIAWWTANW